MRLVVALWDWWWRCEIGGGVVGLVVALWDWW